ncbi:MAG: hypothetical protein HQ521_04305 [Bacteroidetes bacterium]|nr:hypothetical protein [Bacteroidota bacterium]
MKCIYYCLTLCLFVVFGSAVPVSAQNETNNEYNAKKTEVNIAVANIFAKNTIIYPYYYIDGDLYPNYTFSDNLRRPELVLGMKFHGKNGAFRVSTNLNYNSVNENDKNNSSDKFTYTSFSTKISIGYEWHLTFNRLNIYYGVDLSTAYSKASYNAESTNYGTWQKSETKITETAIGIVPLLGVNVYILPNLSIGTEIKLTSEYVTGSTDEKYEYSGSNSGSEISGFRTSFGPLGFLSINIHL